MKKMLINTANRIILMALFIATNATAFAAEGGKEVEGSRWQAVLSMPQFWIGLTVFLAFIGLAIFSGKNKNEHAI